MNTTIRAAVRVPALASLLLATVGATTAFAATAATTTSSAVSGPVQNFCSQVRNSQTSIVAATGTSAEKSKRIGAEWGKIEKVAPAAVKAAVTSVKNAYLTASTQTDAAAKTTLAGISVSGQKISGFVASNCTTGGGNANGPGDGGPRQFDPARLAEIQACFKKEGVTFPTPGQAGQAGQVGQPQGPGAFNDPKFIAAAQKCGFGGGGVGGPGGGFRQLTDAIRKCIADKGITLPTPGAGRNGGGGGAGGTPPTTVKGATAPANGGRFQLDDKTRAAIQACRDANPATN